MYLLTKIGFFSIVKKSFDPIEGKEVKGEDFQVRAVDENEIRNLLELFIKHPKFDKKVHHVPHIMETHFSNYRYRIQVKPAEMQIMFEVLLESIDYMNFLKAMKRENENNPKLPIYHELREKIQSLQKD